MYKKFFPPKQLTYRIRIDLVLNLITLKVFNLVCYICLDWVEIGFGLDLTWLL